MVRKWYKKLSHKLKSRFNKQIDDFNAKSGINQKRPFIIPSKFGFYFGGGILVLLILAFTYANQLIYLIAFFFSSFLFIVMHLTNNNMKHLQIESYQIQSTFLDQIPKISVTLINIHEKYFVRFAEVQIENDQRKMIHELKPKEKITLTFQYPIKSRGLIPYPKIILSTTFPFGIFYSWKRVNWKSHFIVYPARMGELDFPQNNIPSENESLYLNSKRQKSSDGEFVMHKEYSSSDNYKRIDWRVFARKNKLYTKVFSEQENKLIFILFEQYLTGMDSENFEKNLSQITKWIFEAQKNNYICAVQFKDQDLKIPETPREFELLYESLALLKNGGGSVGF